MVFLIELFFRSILCLNLPLNFIRSLVDLISLNDNDHSYEKLIKFSIKLAKEKGYDCIEIVGFNFYKRKIIKKFMPISRKFKHSRFCYYTSNDLLLKSLKNSKNLDFSMIDGDAIL